MAPLTVNVVALPLQIVVLDDAVTVMAVQLFTAFGVGVAVMTKLPVPSAQR